MRQRQVLIVEDDAQLRELVARALREEDVLVVEAATGAEALARLEEQRPSAVIVDIGLPDADGRDLCQALRAQGLQAPVLFLTARDTLSDRLAGFGAGGDDYLVKPFALSELLARLRALLKRAGPDAGLAIGDLQLDPVSYEAAAGDERASLTPTEFRLLAALVAGAGGALTRRDLLRAAWPDGAIVHDNTLDVYIGRLRRKLATIPAGVEIATVHGVGYRLLRESA